MFPHSGVSQPVLGPALAESASAATAFTEANIFGEVVPAPCSCPACGNERLSKMGEGITETLEVIPRSWKVIQTVREKDGQHQPLNRLADRLVRSRVPLLTRPARRISGDPISPHGPRFCKLMPTADMENSTVKAAPLRLIFEAGCFAHAQRKAFELADVEGAARGKSCSQHSNMIYPIALEAVQRPAIQYFEDPGH
jgi:hypothetical protein